MVWQFHTELLRKIYVHNILVKKRKENAFLGLALFKAKELYYT